MCRHAEGDSLVVGQWSMAVEDLMQSSGSTASGSILELPPTPVFCFLFPQTSHFYALKADRYKEVGSPPPVNGPPFRCRAL